MRIPKGVLIFASALATLAVLWGLIAIASILFPGPSGEWAGLSVLFAAAVDFPLGGLALAIALFGKESPSRLRRFCILMSALALALPFIAQIVWKSHLQFHH